MRQRQERVRAGVVAGLEEDPSQCESELGVPGHDLGRDLIHDREQGSALSPGQEGQPVAAEHVGGQLPILAEHRVAQGGEHLVSLAEPATGSCVELGPVPRLATHQIDAQQLTEERVVRERVAVVVERGDQGAPSHEVLEPALPAFRRCERVGQRSVQVVDDRGAHQEVEHVGRLPGHHLRHQVVAHGAIVAGETPDEGAGVRMVAQRQRGEPEAGHPALGPLPEKAQIAYAQVKSAEELLGLAEGERQISVPDFAEVAGDAQSLEPERRVAPRGQDDAQPVGGVIEQPVEVTQHGCFGHLVEVVQYEYDGLLERLELRHQGGKEGVAAPAARRGSGADGRVGTPKRGDHARPEDAPRVGLRTERQPRDPMPGLASLRPARQQGRLAGTSRSGDQGERPLDGSGQLFRKARPLHHPRRNGRNHEPRGENQLPLHGISRVRTLRRKG